MATERTSTSGRRGFLGAAGGLAAAPLLGGAGSPASAQAIGDAGGAAAGASGRRMLGSLAVSSVGLGVQNMSRTYQTTIPTRPEMINIIRTAFDRGVTFYDAAEAYGPHEVERILGEGVGPFRDRVAITSKFGWDVDLETGERRPGLVSRPDRIRLAVEGMLRRLRTDRVDLLYQHRVDPQVPRRRSCARRYHGSPASSPGRLSSRPAPTWWRRPSTRSAAWRTATCSSRIRPGAGRTYTSSHAIVELLAFGKRIGVASNSQKAINNLLEAVEEERGVSFRGAKKSSGEDQFLNGRLVADTTDNAEVEGVGYQLIAGTAWLFAQTAHDRALDHLFVDEAGQVSLANIVAMGVSARNVVPVGDQMQLAQPIQGAHPGGSGVSALDHMLGSSATVPPGRGIFLGVTRRMHPDLCRFVSDAVYDGRLEAEPGNARQRLLLGDGADPGALLPAGLRFVAVGHAGCAQRSGEEAERLRAAYEGLLSRRWTDRHGAEHPLAPADILVVSPSNMQVNLLRGVLPPGARVGTVDRFQGQEAPVVLVSMATSSGEGLPRDIEFLYSRNRLNVAISRARCLAVVYACPRLLEIPCRTVDQMRLVNTLCRAKAYADGLNPTAAP